MKIKTTVIMYMQVCMSGIPASQNMLKESIIFYQNILTFDRTDFSQITVVLKDIALLKK